VSQNNPLMKKSDLITECISKKIKPEPFNYNEKPKPKRAKWIKWQYWIIGILILIAGLIASIMCLL
jgi:hypothetical protein